MQKTSTRRIFTVLLVLALLVCAVAVTATAASVKYDFSQYGNTAAATYDAAHPELGGWQLEKPEGITGVGLNFAESSMGMYDTATRLGSVPKGATAVYNVPTDSQVNIKDYSSIEFTRRLSNGSNVAYTYTATYAVTLVMDDGQTITKEYYWYRPTEGLDVGMRKQVDTDIQSEIMALEGNPKLVQIKYTPYSADTGMYYIYDSALYKPAVKDDPETEADETYAGQGGTNMYFLSSYFQLNETAEIPTGLGTSTDTWDGTAEDVHDGKITGLDASKTYKYAPVHSLDADFVTVTGQTEISGLVGGVYEVRGAEEGKSDSKSTIVVIPKTTQGSKSEHENWVNAENGGQYKRWFGPVSGYWTAGIGTPYANETKTTVDGVTYHKYLASSFNSTAIVGKPVNAVQYTGRSVESGLFYAREVVAYNYAFTPEEQFDVDEVAFKSWQFRYGYHWSTNSPVANGESTYAIYVYTNGDTENPYIYEAPWTSTSSVHVANINASNELDGYVTSMKFVVYYNVPQVELNADAGTGFALYAGLQTYELSSSTFAPEAASHTATTYKIIGLNAGLTYKFSSDGKEWETITGKSEITDLAAGTYYVQEMAGSSDAAASDVIEIVILGGKSFAGNPVAESMSITGLDASAEYEYTTASANGFGEWFSVEKGAESIENLENGLYAIRVKASDGYLPSFEKYVLIYDGLAEKNGLYHLENGIKRIKTSKDMGNNQKPFDIGYWSSSNFSVDSSTDNYNQCSALQAAVRNSGFELATTNEKAFTQLLETNNTYAMTPDEIIDIKDFRSIKLGYSFIGTMSTALLEGMSTKDYTARLRIYVAGSDVPYYDIEHAWNVELNIQSLLPETAHGYVTALQFFPFAFIPEGAAVQDGYKDSDSTVAWSGRYVPGFTNIYDYKVAEAEAIGEFEIEGAINGYNILGLETQKQYAISTDKKSWTTLPEGISYTTVENIGTYYLKVIGQNGNYDSAVVEVVIAGAQPTVTGLTYADGKISGLDSTKTYEYSYANANEYEWVKVTEATEITDLSAGLIAVRLAGDGEYVAGGAQYIFIKGEKSGTIAWAKFSGETSGFKLGYWTSQNKSVYNDALADTELDKGATAGAGPWRVRLAQNWTANYEDRKNLVYRYGFENDEIMPVKNFGAFRISLGHGYGYSWTATTLTALIRIHVKGADVQYYDLEFDYPQWSIMTIDPADVIPADAEGYVTALEIYPIWDTVGSKECQAKNNYPVIRIENYDANPDIVISKAADAKTATEKWRCNFFVQAAPTGLKAELSDDANYIKGYKITGFDANVLYEYSYNGGSAVAIETGATELVCNMPGTYKIRCAATEDYAASAFTTIVVPFVNPVFGKVADSFYDSVISTEFIEGKWANSTANWSKSEANITSNIPKGAKLNEVSYKFAFNEEDYFTVDESPWFSIDFNNELLNFNNASHVLKEAIAAIDIYVVGSDTPYTIYKQWKGKVVKEDGYTDNKVLVNLLEEFPEILGKTVRAFDIRPYSNLDKTPNDYNTTATSDRYMFFRLRYVGFFDTPANIGTVGTAGSDGTRINSLAGVSAEPNVIYGLNATPKSSDFTVYEVYSDGTSNPVTNVTVSIADGFASVAGKDVVKVTHRGLSTDVEVTVGLDRIEIRKNPVKVDYVEGDKVDLTGMELVAVLTNGDEISITESYYTATDTVELGMTAITVVYGGVEASFDINVVELALTSIAINTWPDKELAGGYLEGDEVDLTGLTIKAIYNNGAYDVIALGDFEYTYNADVMTRGAELVITYAGFTLDKIYLTVNGKVIDNLEIATPAEKTVYLTGEELDITGISILVNYEDGSSETITDVNEFLAQADLTTANDEAVVTVLYEGFSVTYTIKVLEIDYVDIETAPKKFEYKVGEEFDTTGLSIYVEYTNAEFIVLEEGFELVYDEFTEAGEYEIEIYYKDVLCDRTIIVTVTEEEAPVVLTGIEVVAPTKVEYTVGDTLDTTGMTVNAIYSDGSTAIVTAQATVDTATLATAGTVTVTVTYEGMTDTFTVTVAEKVVEPENIASGTIGETITWVIEADGTLRISGTGELPNYEKNAPWHNYRKNVKAIVVEDGITRIGRWAFYQCRATSIDIAHSVEFIGQYFIRESYLTEITIDWNVKLEYYAFGRADRLTTITFTEDVKNFMGNLFTDYEFAATIKAPTGSYAHKYTEFYTSKYPDWSDTVTLTFESTGEAVAPIIEFAAAGENAFFAIYKKSSTNWALEISGRGAMKNFPYISDKNAAKGFKFTPMYYIVERGTLEEQNIKSVVVHDDITTIGNYAFYKINKCSSLKFPDTITFIGNGAFWNFVKLPRITIPETVTEIGKHAFNGCANLTSVIIPDTVQKIGEDIFTKCNFTKLVVYTKNQIVIDRLMSDKDAAKINIVTEY